MATIIILAFVLGYALIAFEHTIKVDKAASALITGVVCWILLTFGLDAMPGHAAAAAEAAGSHDFLKHALSEHLGSISEILFFLLGAMTIVELVDVHDGFRVITDRIQTTNKVVLIWVISWIAFVLSSILDNMTTTIIMCALLRRIIHDEKDRWLFGGFVIIAANAGGAWSPIGDVTTIMLWIGGQVTTFKIMLGTFLASVASLLAPLAVVTFFLRRSGQSLASPAPVSAKVSHVTPVKQKFMFILGTAALLAVPVFKSVTHMPPYMGILLAVGVVWYATEFLHRDLDTEIRKGYSVGHVLHRIDSSSILFFLGILLAVGALETSGHLELLASVLNEKFGNIYAITTSIGVLSAIVDNVPLVAASMGMYDLASMPVDSDFWLLLAYCAGTGGSMLIIGSAAGVASMGILHINFMWYMKRISIYAAIGYFTGIAVFWLQHHSGLIP